MSSDQSRPLDIYLRDQEAIASAANDLAARAASAQRDRPWAGELAAVARAEEEDLARLRGLMQRLGVRPDPLLRAATRAGERLGRLKPNGRLLRRAPLSDLVEVESLVDAMQGKLNSWRALREALPERRAELDALATRAEEHRDRMSGLHATVAAQVLAPS